MQAKAEHRILRFLQTTKEPLRKILSKLLNFSVVLYSLYKPSSKYWLQASIGSWSYCNHTKNYFSSTHQKLNKNAQFLFAMKLSKVHKAERLTGEHDNDGLILIRYSTMASVFVQVILSPFFVDHSRKTTLFLLISSLHTLVHKKVRE